MRSPMTMSAPSSQLAQEARDLVEVVGEVGVGHHDVGAARRGEPGDVRAAVAASGLVDDVGSGGLGSSALPSSDPLSATITSPAIPASSSALHAAVTHCSMFSASLRHGMITESSFWLVSSGASGIGC